MKGTRIAFSFDDGRKDNYDIVIPILKKYDLTATFNISTAYVDRTISISNLPCSNEAMTIDNVREIHGLGFEVACHGDCHNNDFLDIEKGLKKLKEWLGWNENYKPGFASPHSNLSSDDIIKNADKYKAMFSYMRIAAYEKEHLANRIIRKVAHISNSSKLYSFVFKNNIGGIKGDFICTSVPILNVATLEQVKSIIERAKAENQDCILMFHSIVPKGAPYYDDVWSWDVRKFEDFCKWLQEQRSNAKLEVMRTIDLL